MDDELANANLIIDDIWTQNSKTRRDKSLKLLTKIYKNILNTPSELKYRRLNIFKINSKPNIIPQVRQLLLSSGFIPDIDGLHINLNDNKLNLCISIGNALINRINLEIKQLNDEREKIKKKTAEKTKKYIQNSNFKKNILLNKIAQQNKDIKKEKDLKFRVIQRSSLKTNVSVSEKRIKSNIINKNKKIKKIRKDIINSFDNIKNRLEWKISSKCQIYSQKQKRWLNGIIIGIKANYNNPNYDILTVKYNSNCTKEYQRNSEYIRIRLLTKTKSTFRKDPEILDNEFMTIIEYWFDLTNIRKKKDVNITRLIIAFCLNAYRLILTKTGKSVSRYNSSVSNSDYEREYLYSQLKNKLYLTLNEYNSTKLPQPVSGINFQKEYILLITNKHIQSRLLEEYEITNKGKSIIFTVYIDLVSSFNDDNDNYNNNMMMMNRYRHRHNQYINNIWAVAVHKRCKFKQIGIKTKIKRFKVKNQSSGNTVNTINAMPPAPALPNPNPHTINQMNPMNRILSRHINPQNTAQNDDQNNDNLNGADNSDDDDDDDGGSNSWNTISNSIQYVNNSTNEIETIEKIEYIEVPKEKKKVKDQKATAETKVLKNK